MICPKCGKETTKDAKFCMFCGEELPEIKEEPVAEVLNEETVEDADAEGTANKEEDSTKQEPSSAINSSQSEKTYAESCFAAAWRDVKESDGWFGKLLLLTLIGIVPVLNFALVGYIARWAADVAVGNRFTMPSVKIAPYFKIGFFVLVYDVIFGIALGIVVAILDVAPFFGTLVGLALAFMSTTFLLLAEIRVVLKDSIAGGFDFKDLWKAYTKQLGTLIANGAIAPWVFAVVAAIVMGICYGIVFLLGGGGVAYLSLYGASTMFSIMGAGIMVVLFVVVLIFGYVASALSVLGTLLGTRAVGHYIKRHVPEWKDDSKMPEIPNVLG